MAKPAKQSNKIIKLSLPGRPGEKRLTAAEAVTFGRQLHAQKNFPAAIAVLQQVTKQLPHYTLAWEAQFDALNSLGNFPLMAKVAQQCLAKTPRSIPARLALAITLRMEQRHQEALELVSQAAKLSPGNAKVLNHLGIIQKEMGANDAALLSFNRCITINPNYCAPYWNRSDLLKSPTEADINHQLRLLNNSTLSLSDQARIHYSLSRAFEYSGNPTQQFFHIEQGARKKRESIQYDHTNAIQQINRIPECFTPALLDQAQVAPDTSTGAIPVFICGLPRSGTTLVEQILSSHSLVSAGDELTQLPMACEKLLQAKGIQQPYPEWADALTRNDWQSIGNSYRDTTKHLQSTPYFTDKNLLNYQAIGLIHMVLPEAKIIFCERDPMDNLWSCYRQLFGSGLSFTYSQTELADTWFAVEQLKSYWKQRLGHKILFLKHENLLAEQRSMTEQLLEFVGLPWEDQCLQFYNNNRAVRTTSTLQVRQPLDPSRSGNWQAFEQHLEPMLKRLQALKERTQAL